MPGACIPGEGWSRACPPGSAARRSGAPSPRSHGQRWLPSRAGPRPQKWWTSLWTRTPGANTSCKDAVSLCSCPCPPALPATQVRWFNSSITSTGPVLGSTKPRPAAFLHVHRNVVWFQHHFKWFCLLQGGFLPGIDGTKFKTRLQLLTRVRVSDGITACKLSILPPSPTPPDSRAVYLILSLLVEVSVLLCEHQWFWEMLCPHWFQRNWRVFNTSKIWARSTFTRVDLVMLPAGGILCNANGPQQMHWTAFN